MENQSKQTTRKLLILVRRYDTVIGGVISDIYINGIKAFIGLENSSTLVKDGVFKAKVRKSERLGNVIELLNVPNRSAILFHVGNRPTDSRGCILVGLVKTKGSISYSRVSIDMLCMVASNYDEIEVKISSNMQLTM